MNYGDSRYAELIRIETLKRFPLTQVEFLEERLSMHNYYKRLSLVGFAAFNFRWQEALGNILFLIWNGAKVFLRADSSVYQQFRNWDVQVYTLDQFNEDFLNDLLSPEDRQKNRGIVEELFAESRISEYWKRLVFNPTGI